MWQVFNEAAKFKLMRQKLDSLIYLGLDVAEIGCGKFLNDRVMSELRYADAWHIMLTSKLIISEFKRVVNEQVVNEF